MMPTAMSTLAMFPDVEHRPKDGVRSSEWQRIYNSISVMMDVLQWQHEHRHVRTLYPALVTT